MHIIFINFPLILIFFLSLPIDIWWCLKHVTIATIFHSFPFPFIELSRPLKPMGTAKPLWHYSWAETSVYPNRTNFTRNHFWNGHFFITFVCVQYAFEYAWLWWKKKLNTSNNEINTLCTPTNPGIIQKNRTEFKNRGRAVSMTRLDQLAQPTRRKGEHIRAVIERERKQQIESNMAAERATSVRKMSRSLTHLSSASSARSAAPLRLFQSATSKSSAQIRPLRKLNATKSMTQLVTAKLLSTPSAPTVVQARKSHEHATTIQIEIDSRTTNVSVAGVFVFAPFFFFFLVNFSFFRIGRRSLLNNNALSFCWVYWQINPHHYQHQPSTQAIHKTTLYPLSNMGFVSLSAELNWK